MAVLTLSWDVPSLHMHQGFSPNFQGCSRHSAKCSPVLCYKIRVVKIPEKAYWCIFKIIILRLQFTIETV